jgi:hypothetical protein
VVRRWPRWTLVVTHGGRDAHHAGATHLPVMAIITTGHSRSPLKVLFAPLVAAFDAPLCAVSGDVGRCLLVATHCHLPASLCRVKHGSLIAGGALGGDAVWLHKHAPEEVAMSALLRALRTVFMQLARATLVSLAANMGFAAPSLPLPWRGLG